MRCRSRIQENKTGRGRQNGPGRKGKRMTTGKIIRGVGGFYYVCLTDGTVYECRARGIFRKEGKKPLVGDNVRITILHEKDMEGSVDEILPRSNQLIRPAAANIDQVLLVFASEDPRPDLALLDRFLIYMKQKNLPVVILFNKSDLSKKETLDQLENIYRGSGHPVLFVSVKTGSGLEQAAKVLEGKTTLMAGPSGVGKSSLTNFFCPEAGMEIGELSRKIRRGKQTTRHTQLNRIGENTFLLDTPGFSTLYLQELDERELAGFYPEFTPYEDFCRFPGCMHWMEPECAVKSAVEEGKIPVQRYDNYILTMQWLKEQRRY